MGTLGALFGGVYLAMPSGKKPATQAPPINASSSDEADCIQWATPPSPLRACPPPPPGRRILTTGRNFLKEADKEEKGAAKH